MVTRSAVGVRLIGAALALALTATACAGAGEAGQTASAQQSREESVLAFAQCMRDHGIDMRDPQVVEGGGVRISPPRGSTQSERVNDPAFADAREACDEHLQRGVQELDPEHSAEQQDRALAFAQCMRSHGVDIPDPDFSGGPRIRMTPLADADLDDPDVQEALDTCREEAFGGQGSDGGMIMEGHR